MNGKPGRLAVTIDGQPLPEEEARAFWARFSDHMDANRGDLKGFAAKEGLASVHPAMQGDRPVLVASRSVAQKPYANAPTLKEPGGKGERRGGGGPSGGSSRAQTSGQGAPPRGASGGPARGGPPKPKR